MKKIYFIFIFQALILISYNAKGSQSQANSYESTKKEPFRALVLTERGGQHGSFTDEALKWLDTFSKENDFEYTEINNAKKINEKFLSEFKVIIQLDYPPYTWTKEGEDAFVKYIEEGRGGWVGFHHATLLGEFDGYPMWQWFPALWEVSVSRII